MPRFDGEQAACFHCHVLGVGNTSNSRSLQHPAQSDKTQWVCSEFRV